MNPKKIDIDNLSQLYWACSRRGMLELDVYLGNFFKEAYPILPDSDKVLFVKLLERPDPELFEWLMGHDAPADQELLTIVEKIRHHARTRI